MNLAPRRLVLGHEADSLDMKTRIEMTEDPLPKPTVLVPDAAPRGAVMTKPSGTHTSPRPHERRGHPRQLSGD